MRITGLASSRRDEGQKISESSGDISLSPNSDIPRHLTLTPARHWHWHAIRNWFSALGSTSISQSLFWDMFGIIITKFSQMYSLRWALCLCVLCRMLTWVPSLAGMYQVSPRHHYVCIFTNVKILHNMSGTDRDTPSAHPLPGSQGHKSP